MMTRERTADLAKGKWHGILSAMGFDERTLSGKNCPCPMCEGKDRFRFTNYRDDGLWICNQCGSGDGFKLLSMARGMDFKAACAEIDPMVGNIEACHKVRVPQCERMKGVREMWNTGVPVVRGDPVHRYLSGRGIAFVGAFPDIRCSHQVFIAGRSMSAMLALLRDNEGQPVTVHQTFIENGKKAAIDKPRLMMKGALPDGPLALRLGEIRPHIGIAEGTESAAGAARRYGLPVWAAQNATLMERWLPPPGVERVTVFLDNDANFRGHKAGYTVANRIASNDRIKVEVDVKIPARVGTDFWDEMESAA